MMMAGLSVAKIKDTVDGIFPLRTFCLSLALLVSLLLVSVGIYQLIFAEPVFHPALTGKTIGIVEIAKAVQDEPIQTVPDIVPVPEKKADPTPEPLTAIEDSIAGLSQQTPYGALPIIRESDGLKSFDAYKAPFKLKAETKGVISLVMTDYGLSEKLAQSAVDMLPAGTSFVASPYAANLQPQISGARAKGMEVWMGVPIEGTENNKPINIGPNSLLAGLNAKENLSRLNTHLGRATGYAGIAIDVIPNYSKDSPELRAVMNYIATHGLGIAQLEPSDNIISVAVTPTGAPFIEGDLWLDKATTKDDILNALAELEKKSLTSGHAVAAFHPLALTIDMIAEWQKSLAAKNIQLAPLTYAVQVARTDPQPSPETAPKAEITPHGSQH